MAESQFPHIFIKKAPQAIDYISPKKGGGEINIPKRNRQKHGNFLKKKFKELWKQSKKENADRLAVALPVKTGHYIEFRSKIGFDLVTKSLENLQGGIRLLNIREEENKKIDRKNNNKAIKKVAIATIYIPGGKTSFFLKKVEDYLKKETKTRKPKNQKLIDSIEDIRLAVLDSFWQDDRNFIPKNNESTDCEIWLRINEQLPKGLNKENAMTSINKQSETFFKICDGLNNKEQSEVKTNKIKYKKNQIISFPERTVVLITANKNQLMELIKSSDQIAEIRRVREIARFWLEQDNKEQVEWVKDLLNRMVMDKESKISVCLLDTGVNNGHPLVSPVLPDKDCHTVNPKWGVNDKDGHGTLMSGLVIYGDLQRALEATGTVNIRHKLESVKLIPFSGTNNRKELYGYRTKQGINRVEIERPNRKRTVCMAVTSTDDRNKGRPSSWSGAVDQITSGSEESGKKRLLIISAGNVQGQKEWKNYPKNNLTNAVHDPAQSWNALTVGAYTNKASIKDPKLKGYKPIAKEGELSPFSTTSVIWEGKKWPVKPDIVLEGGNVAEDETSFVTVSEDLSLLSLHHKPQERQFEMINATSAATAQASWIAAQIQTQYPEIWPETVRALMIHSADWNESMKNQFLKNSKKKNDYKTMLRIFGYGVPDLNKAVFSYKNSLNLVSEQTLQPFRKKNSSYSTKDMHFYKMPWPKDALKTLPDHTVVHLKFTLSYFIEPGPGEIGWKDKYRYPSYGLRFALIKPQEKEDQFMKRINKAVRNEEEKPNPESDDRWMLGANNRNLGSLHSDILQGTALEIAECNFMTVYPTIGWWKERHHLGKWNKKARYSLIVSLSTPEEKIDLYTPIATQIGIPVTT